MLYYTWSVNLIWHASILQRVIQNKSAVLAFLLNLSQRSNNTQVNTLLKNSNDIGAGSSLKSSSNVIFLTDSKSSVKRLYTASKTSARSSRSQMSTNTNGQCIQWVGSETDVVVHKDFSSGSSTSGINCKYQ